MTYWVIRTLPGVPHTATMETTDMTKVTASQWLNSWGNGLNASGPAIQAGVNAVKTAPGIAAAAQQNLMLANITAAITSGRWAAAVSAVTLPQWQQAMISKGIPHIPQGVSAAQQNKVAQITKFLGNVDTAVNAIASMPKGGLQNNINRAVAYMNAMSTASQSAG